MTKTISDIGLVGGEFLIILHMSVLQSSIHASDRQMTDGLFWSECIPPKFWLIDLISTRMIQLLKF